MNLFQVQVIVLVLFGSYMCRTAAVYIPFHYPISTHLSYNINERASIVPSNFRQLNDFDDSSSVKYDFSYGIHDTITGDIKSQKESNNNGVVTGTYSLIDSDGYKRIVSYTADDANGFNAVVQREPIVATFVPKPLVQIQQPSLDDTNHYFPSPHQDSKQPEHPDVHHDDGTDIESNDDAEVVDVQNFNVRS